MNSKLVASMEATARSRLVTIGSSAPLLGAAKLLSSTHIGLVVVCGSDGAMVGVVTKTDVVRQFSLGGVDAGTAAVADVMTRDVVFCRPTDGLPDLLSMMGRRGFVHVPVIDEEAMPWGVVNARDALRLLWAEEKYEEVLLRDYVMGIGYR
ncbi:MAG: CBS domain-containing protein [Methyloversatilis sp.]|jgi:CBS domain-containing protein|nr:CBS domain-containing protein [Methyloversatilis sp.]MCA3139510.1 CBS domain-containing protein [Rhodocyclaceae bacterium]